MSDPIKAALEAARDEAEVHWGIDVRFPWECSRDDAERARADAFVAGIAAFLRTFDEGERLSPHYLAAAVEAAARGDV